MELDWMDVLFFNFNPSCAPRVVWHGMSDGWIMDGWIDYINCTEEAPRVFSRCKVDVDWLLATDPVRPSTCSGAGGRVAEWYWMGRQRPCCCGFESRTPHREGGHVAVMLRGVWFDPGWQVFHLS